MENCQFESLPNFIGRYNDCLNKNNGRLPNDPKELHIVLRNLKWTECYNVEKGGKFMYGFMKLLYAEKADSMLERHGKCITEIKLSRSCGFNVFTIYIGDLKEKRVTQAVICTEDSKGELWAVGNIINGRIVTRVRNIVNFADMVKLLNCVIVERRHWWGKILTFFKIQDMRAMYRILPDTRYIR